VKDEQAPAKGKDDLKQIDDERIEVKIGSEFFTNYYFGSKYPKPFLHPLIGPYGKSVTSDYPISPDVAGETNDHPQSRKFSLLYVLACVRLWPVCDKPIGIVIF